MILCCGEALIDMVPVADTVTGTAAFAPLPGGAIFNTAIALGRLDTPVQFFSGLSTDLFGAQLAGALEASGVATGLVKRSNRPTTLAFVKLTGGHAQYTFYDENTAGRMLSLDDLPGISADISALYFGGISLCAEPAASAYEALALREARNAVIMLDPNIRTSFIEDAPVYRKRLDRMIGVADIVKVSDEDLDWIMRDTSTVADKAARMLQQGPSLVIITKGAKGAEAYGRDGSVVTVPAPQVTVVDTVGAGDTFNAGFLAGLHSRALLSKAAIANIGHADLNEALAFAAKVAAVTVSRQGADPPTLSDLAE